MLKDKEKEIQAVLLDVFENPQFPSSGARQSRIQQALVQHTLSGFLQKQGFSNIKKFTVFFLGLKIYLKKILFNHK